jgi:hypothetical protein
VKKCPPSPAAERLATIAWDVDHEKYDDLAKIVRAQGGSFEVHEDGTAVARAVLCTAGFSRNTDPMTAKRASLFGVYWPTVAHTGEAQGIIKQWWEEGGPVLPSDMGRRA